MNHIYYTLRYCKVISMDEWTKYIQENNEVVEVLIVSHYKVSRQIILYRA